MPPRHQSTLSATTSWQPHGVALGAETQHPITKPTASVVPNISRKKDVHSHSDALNPLENDYGAWNMNLPGTSQDAKKSTRFSKPVRYWYIPVSEPSNSTLPKASKTDLSPPELPPKPASSSRISTLPLIRPTPSHSNVADIATGVSTGSSLDKAASFLDHLHNPQPVHFSFESYGRDVPDPVTASYPSPNLVTASYPSPNPVTSCYPSPNPVTTTYSSPNVRPHHPNKDACPPDGLSELRLHKLNLLGSNLSPNLGMEGLGRSPPYEHTTRPTHRSNYEQTTRPIHRSNLFSAYGKERAASPDHNMSEVRKVHRPPCPVDHRALSSAASRQDSAALQELQNHLQTCRCTCNHLGYGNYQVRFINAKY